MQSPRNKIILSLLFALFVFLALSFYADLPRLVGAFEKFQWNFLPLALAATLANYLLRFLRWHYYLSVIGVKNVPSRDSLLIFLSGFALTITPGKLGEVVKSFLLKDRYDAPVSYTASIVVAERLTDVLGMFFLAAVGLAFFPIGIGAVAIFLVTAGIFVAVVQQRALAERLLDLFAKLPFIGRFVHLARNLYKSAYLLLRVKPLLIAIALGILAWFAECIAFFLVLIGIGQTPTIILLLQSTFIYAAASLFGAVSMLPGGLGATEGGLALLLEQIVNVAREQSVAAALIVRLCTLWFAVLLGVLALLTQGLPRTKLETQLQ